MAQMLDDRTVKGLLPPTAGNRVTYDSEVSGFGVRVTAAGARSFILNYRAKGKEHRLTIGGFPSWSTKAARQRAGELRRQIDIGGNPMADRKAEREAPTVNALADRFEGLGKDDKGRPEPGHLEKLRPTTASDYRSLLRQYVRPELGALRVADVNHSHIEKLHASIARKYPYRANRCAAMLGKMFDLALKWGMRPDNPVRGLELAREEKRERYLEPEEIARLGNALDSLPEKSSANAIRLLLLTGARKGEVLKARWSEFDLSSGVWVKPSAHTKTKRSHRVPLSTQARALLIEMRTEAEKEIARGGEAEFLFPSDSGRPLQDVKRSWATVCKRAGLGSLKNGKFVPNARIHDLRHSYASILVSQGLSLPVIGALLGHTQVATTHRYAHLVDDTLRKATEQVGVFVSGRIAS